MFPFRHKNPYTETTIFITHLPCLNFTIMYCAHEKSHALPVNVLLLYNSPHLSLHAGMDFNDTQPFEVTMAAGTEAVIAMIPIVDDEINEAEEEFVVVLSVTGTFTNPVEFTTQTTVCRIPQSDRKCHLKCSTKLHA